MKLNNLTDLLQHELKDLYSAEQQIIEALPKMQQKATNPELAEAFGTHLEQTNAQLKRLTQIASIYKFDITGHTCKGIQGIIEEGDQLLKEMSSDLLDAGMIAAAQRVEHYEMAGYGAARSMANELGWDEAVNLLQETLDEEGQTDKLLTTLADGGWFTQGINDQALETTV